VTVGRIVNVGFHWRIQRLGGSDEHWLCIAMDPLDDLLLAKRLARKGQDP